MAALARLLGRPVSEVRFDATDLEQARALGAAHGEGWQSIIVGAEIANQLVADQLARTVKEMRRRARGQQEAAAFPDVGTPRPGGDDAAADVEDVERTAHEVEEGRRKEREADREVREQATLFNLELGRAVYSTLSRVRVDEATLKILTSVEIVGELADVAMRGARYGLPGWVTETRQKNGKTKYGCLDRPEAEQRASDYLARVEKTGEIAGRQIALLVMATYTDQNAIAASNRSWHQSKARGPWADEVDALLDALVREKLPESTLTMLAPVLERRQQEQEERAKAKEARKEAISRLEAIEERIGELTVDQVEQAEQDLEAAWTAWTPRYNTLRQALHGRRQELTAETGGQ